MGCDRHRRLLRILWAATLLAACDGGGGAGGDAIAPEETASPAAGAAPAASRPVRIALGAGDPAARSWPDARALPPERAPALLRAGFHPFEGEGEARAVWTREGSASIEVPVVTPGPLRVGLRLRAGDAGSPWTRNQTARVFWNGEPLETLALGDDWRDFEVEVPPAAQRLGLNRLELVPSHSFNPFDPADPNRPNRAQGMQLASLRFSGSGEAARGDAPLRADGGEIEQTGGSVLATHLALPARARLRGSLRARGAPDGSEAVITLVPRHGGEQVLWRAAPGGDELAIDLDLGAWAGDFVALNVALTGPAPALVRWSDLRVEGVEPLREAAPPPAGAPYNLLIVLLDSLRADHLPAYGGDLETPHLDRFATEGVTLDARAPSSWTRPSTASLLSGVAPSTHGIFRLDQALPPSLPYLPELLSEAGYRTVGVTANPVLSDHFGFERGFDAFHAAYTERDGVWREAHPRPEDRARDVWERYVEPAVESGEPFFVYIHELDPHSAYEPPPPYDALYEFGRKGQRYRGRAGSGRLQMAIARRLGTKPDAEGQLFVHSQYKGEVSFMDAYFGGLLERLEAAGLADDTVVVLASDHGEEFWEHDGVGHGHTVYEELLRVPLILRLPGVLPAGGRPQVEAELQDLVPTLLGLLGVEAGARFDGAPLLAELLAEDAPPPARRRPRIAHAHRGAQAALKRGRWKLIRYAGEPRHYALYDLEVDPAEQIDRFAQEPIVGRALIELLDRTVADRRARAAEGAGLSGAVPAELEERLRALGYGS